MGVTTVYITEAVEMECELWVAAELRYTPRPVQKIRKLRRGETHSGEVFVLSLSRRDCMDGGHYL